MNLTVLSLLTSSFLNSPFFTGTPSSKVSISRSKLIHFFPSSFYNVKKLQINQVQFRYFQNTPIIVNSEDVDISMATLYYQHTFVFFDNETISINNSIFYHCHSPNSGGAIYFINQVGKLDISDVFFYNCLSYMIGGAIYCDSKEVSLISLTFSLCNAVNSQAGYFQTTEYCTYNRLLFYNCFIPGEITYDGPVLDIIDKYEDNWDMASFTDINASYNTIKTSFLCPLISIHSNGYYGFYMTFFTLFENTCPIEIEISGDNYPMANAQYLNLVQNHVSAAVFMIEDALLFAQECFIGHDYGVSYFPKQTPNPTQSPMATLVPPTAPNFTLQGYRRSTEKVERHFQYVFSREKRKFEKVFFVPQREVAKNVQAVQMTKIANRNKQNHNHNTKPNKDNNNNNNHRYSTNKDRSKENYNNNNRYSTNKDRSKDQYSNRYNTDKHNSNDRYNNNNRYRINKDAYRSNENYRYSTDNSNDHYNNNRYGTENYYNVRFGAGGGRRRPSETSDAVLALFRGESSYISFDSSMIDYPEIEFVECEEQCFISDFETYPIDEHTLISISIEIEEETTEASYVVVRFPTNAMNIAIICIIVAASIALYVMVMSVVCFRARAVNENADSPL